MLLIPYPQIDSRVYVEQKKDLRILIIIIKENKIRGLTLFKFKIYYKNTVISRYSARLYNGNTWEARVGRPVWATKGDLASKTQ